LQIKIFALEKQQVIFEDLGIINYKSAWDYQEELVKKNLEIKSEASKLSSQNLLVNSGSLNDNYELETKYHLIF
jgi:lipoyl(octanoyl) transferase